MGVLCIISYATADVEKGEWKEQKRKLKYWYKDSEPQGFKDDVDNAAAKWNEKSTGWTLNKGTEADHNVKVELGQTSGNGEARANWNNIAKVTIVINKNGTTGPRQRTIEHEFGHAMRLNDVKDDEEDDGDIMEAAQGANEDNLQPTANDLKEAKDAAQTTKRQAVATPRSTVRSVEQPYQFTPDDGVDFRLDEASSVQVTAIDPTALSVNTGSLTFSANPDVVSVRMTALAGSIHNELFRVTVNYTAGGSETFDGRVIVTNQPPPTNQFPHAVVDKGPAQHPGPFVRVSAAASYHDAVGANLIYVWEVDDTIGIKGDATDALLELTPGQHQVTLTVEDDWGQTSEATVTIDVTGGIPTLSEYGVGVMALLLVTAATVVIMRRRAMLRGRIYSR